MALSSTGAAEGGAVSSAGGDDAVETGPAARAPAPGGESSGGRAKASNTAKRENKNVRFMAATSKVT